jgi:hypothetical protein
MVYLSALEESKDAFATIHVFPYSLFSGFIFNRTMLSLYFPGLSARLRFGHLLALKSGFARGYAATSSGLAGRDAGINCIRLAHHGRICEFVLSVEVAFLKIAQINKNEK